MKIIAILMSFMAMSSSVFAQSAEFIPEERWGTQLWVDAAQGGTGDAGGAVETRLFPEAAKAYAFEVRINAGEPISERRQCEVERIKVRTSNTTYALNPVISEASERTYYSADGREALEGYGSLMYGFTLPTLERVDVKEVVIVWKKEGVHCQYLVRTTANLFKLQRSFN